MIQYERIAISEGTDLNESDKSKESMICHYWYFKDIGYEYQPYVCNKFINGFLLSKRFHVFKYKRC